MQTVAGIFLSRAEAERAALQLEAVGIPRDRITLLVPGSDPARVPTDEGEPPGTGAALGAVVGGATGAAVGLPLGAAVTVLVPGIGPVIAFGLLGAALLGAGGAAVGSALEAALATGLPRDELFVYENALLRGRSVVVALVDDEDRAEDSRRVLTDASAESVDAAREQWWIGVRDVERQQYGPAAFARDEPIYRQGFEAALALDARDRLWSEARDTLQRRYGADVHVPAFRAGWERGQAYRRALGGAPLKRTA